MTTASIATDATIERRPVPFSATLASEGAKLASLRSTWVTVVVSTVFGVGLTALTSAAVAATWRDWPPEEVAGFEPVLFSLLGTIVPGIALVTLAVKVVTNEYSSGMMRLTMTATPGRGRVLAAKVLVVGALVLVTTAVATVASFLVGQAIFARAGLDAASLGDGATRRAILLASLLGPVMPVLAVALAMLLRSTAAAVTAALGLIILPSFLGPMLPQWWQHNVLGYLPGPASDSIALGDLQGSPLYHPSGTSAVVLVAWLAGTLGVAALALSRRDV
jgi:ABC-2 type transport system permease protein